MDYNWYIVHTLSGSEKKVRQIILENAERKGIKDLFEEVFVPVIEVPDFKRGKKVLTEKKFLPGYILIKMVLTDEAWQLVKSTPKITGFLGNGNKPQAVTQFDVDKIKDQLKDKANVKSSKVFEIGESVKVLDGPFESFTGVIESVDVEKMKLSVLVSIFGKSTPIELSFNQVERI